jgi:hypothetical protein
MTTKFSGFFSTHSGSGAVLLAMGVLAYAFSGASPLAVAGTCAPASATVEFQSDDVFYFYLNGHVEVSGVEAGPNPTVVSIPIADFSAPGSPNYIAVADANNTATFVGVDWLITIQCADGSVSFITDADSTFQMYDDLSPTASAVIGGSPPNPPPAESGNCPARS